MLKTLGNMVLLSATLVSLNLIIADRSRTSQARHTPPDWVSCLENPAAGIIEKIIIGTSVVRELSATGENFQALGTDESFNCGTSASSTNLSHHAILLRAVTNKFPNLKKITIGIAPQDLWNDLGYVKLGEIPENALSILDWLAIAGHSPKPSPALQITGHALKTLFLPGYALDYKQLLFPDLKRNYRPRTTRYDETTASADDAIAHAEKIFASKKINYNYIRRYLTFFKGEAERAQSELALALIMPNPALETKIFKPSELDDLTGALKEVVESIGGVSLAICEAKEPQGFADCCHLNRKGRAALRCREVVSKNE